MEFDFFSEIMYNAKFDRLDVLQKNYPQVPRAGIKWAYIRWMRSENYRKKLTFTS